MSYGDVVILPALGLHNMMFDDYTPGCCRFKGTLAERKANPLFVEILTVTPMAAVAFFDRAIGDFNRSVGKKATAKAKKDQQLDAKGLMELLDICCVYTWLTTDDNKRLSSHFTNMQMDKCRTMFLAGLAGHRFNHYYQHSTTIASNPHHYTTSATRITCDIDTDCAFWVSDYNV